jgi:hypothetical protein
MVRTYWLVPVFNEASGNLDLQLSARRPNRCLSAPCYVDVNSTLADPPTAGVGQNRNAQRGTIPPWLWPMIEIRRCPPPLILRIAWTTYSAAVWMSPPGAREGDGAPGDAELGQGRIQFQEKSDLAL